jgi:hypothetical protein
MGHRGPGAGRQISRGGILKNIEIEVWYVKKKKKKAVHEREIEGRSTLKTMLVPQHFYFVS